MTDWQARALAMRKAGNTVAFIASQVSRAYGVDPGLVAAFLAGREQAQEAKEKNS